MDKSKQCNDAQNTPISKGGVTAVDYRKPASVNGGQMGPLSEPSDRGHVRGK
jgi:hypothetical protein